MTAKKALKEMEMAKNKGALKRQMDALCSKRLCCFFLNLV